MTIQVQKWPIKCDFDWPFHPSNNFPYIAHWCVCACVRACVGVWVWYVTYVHAFIYIYIYCSKCTVKAMKATYKCDWICQTNSIHFEKHIKLIFSPAIGLCMLMFNLHVKLRIIKLGDLMHPATNVFIKMLGSSITLIDHALFQ